jgi:hypothetical protein
MNSERWLFDQAPNVAAVTSTHITKNGCPILLVTHYEDDHSWGFQSGKPVSMADAQVVGMSEIIRLDATLFEIADLPPGWSAERDTVGGEWRRYKDDWESEEK